MNNTNDSEELVITQFTADDDDSTQITQMDIDLTAGCSSQSSNTDTGHNLTFTSDNASDITKALRSLGEFTWFGCCGHHFNLIAQAVF